MDERFLLDIALILFTTKFFGLALAKFKIPQVVGALLAGLFLGPSVSGLVNPSDLLEHLSKIGVILIMFEAGIETDLKAIRRDYASILTIAFFDISVPLIVTFGVTYAITSNLMVSIFVAILFMSTTVGITVETLHELKKMKSKSGMTILNTAIVDDIVGIILLTFVVSVTAQSGSAGSTSIANAIGVTSLKIIAFFIFTAIVGVIAHKVFKMMEVKIGVKHRNSIFALSLCFFMSYVAYRLGLSEVTGAYFTGLMLSNNKETSEYVEDKTNVLSYLFFSPIFFAVIGIDADLTNFSSSIIYVTLILLVVAIATKLFGCYFGAKLAKYSNSDALCVGIGMIARGEVALIILNMGVEMKIFPASFSTTVIIIVIVTNIITPILLKAAYKNNTEFDSVGTAPTAKNNKAV